MSNTKRPNHAPAGRPPKRVPACLPIVVFAAAMLLAGPACAVADEDTPHATVKVKLEGADEKVHVVEQPDGAYRFVLRTADGHVPLSPDAFARRVHSEQTRRSFLETLLNITSPWGVAWVVLGLAGQVLFAGRMLVQWLVSEKHKRSVVPPVFWWMSLGGASMLLAYFLWRKDIVGVLGQCTGWLIYTRNLWMIYRPHPGAADALPTVTDDPGPEPQLER